MYKRKRKSFELSVPLFRMSRKRHDRWTIGDSCEGVMIFGAPGSAKTSGPAQMIALAMLRAGYGGLVMVAKPDEVRRWVRYAILCGREDDFILVHPDGPHRLNILDYEYNRPGAGGHIADNIADMLTTIMTLSQAGQSGSASDPFWPQATHNMVADTTALAGMAYGRIQLDDLSSIIASAPRSPEQLKNRDWAEQSVCCKCLWKARQLRDSGKLMPDQVEMLDQVAQFFFERFIMYPPRTRGSIEAMFEAAAGRLQRPPFRRLFSTDTTFTPEMAQEGKIIVVALPVKEFGPAGRFAQILIKIAFQRAAERRSQSEQDQMRPLFLFADECQHFVIPQDLEFQATARSSKVATVYITQNLPGLQAAYAGVSAHAMTEGLLGTLNTKIFTANSEPATNRWASDLISQTHRYRFNFGGGEHEPRFGQHPPGQSSNQSNAGASQQLEYEVPPSTFLTLRNGGPKNKLQVDAIVHQNARRWQATGKSFIKTEFSQEPN